MYIDIPHDIDKARDINIDLAMTSPNDKLSHDNGVTIIN
jgi:hypothetical protein